ncbi:MAG: hypothetical protein R3F41_02680 [Gammaproteobacteria bacterium]|nr:hypothetical protein [Pseudomonadales bacterium]MCP5345801.1 hypothetical protein [Pseudomonadales bacterium]
MTREKSLDMFIVFLNVIAIMVLVGILSVMVNTADARDSGRLIGQIDLADNMELVQV